ncbi:hypothetical protein RND81_06G165400 [Saponaria officinalis]|uniref:CCHC-type domain-containing protein n=1 Tax=Saponaria officinalis TaxID=3572 RepID=A0AAW1KCE3_SAPOF
MYVHTSKQLWSELNERYGEANSLELYHLRKDIGAIVQDNLSFVEYYGKIKRTWEDIDSIDPIPDCSCGALTSYTCQFLKRLLDKETQIKLIQFLMGLNTAYESVQTTVLTMDPPPSINKTLSLLQKIERQKQLSDSVDALGDAAVFAANKHLSARYASGEASWKRPKLDREDKVYKECNLCHKKGHTRDECYKLQTCFYCHALGHVMEQCYKLKNVNSERRRGRGSTRGGSYAHKRGANHVSHQLFADFNQADFSPLEDLCPPVTDRHHESVAVHSADHSPSVANPGMVDDIVNTVMTSVTTRIKYYLK